MCVQVLWKTIQAAHVRSVADKRSTQPDAGRSDSMSDAFKPCWLHEKKTRCHEDKNKRVRRNAKNNKISTQAEGVLVHCTSIWYNPVVYSRLFFAWNFARQSWVRFENTRFFFVEGKDMFFFVEERTIPKNGMFSPNPEAKCLSITW